MCPSREEDVSWATQVGVGRVVGARWEEPRSFQGGSVSGAGTETTRFVSDCVVAGNDIAGRHAKASVVAVSVQNGVTTRTILVPWV